jgi:hypothetical protein
MELLKEKKMIYVMGSLDNNLFFIFDKSCGKWKKTFVKEIYEQG